MIDGVERYRDANRLFISLSADEPWQGKLLFDVPRHKLHLGLTLDDPRINQFPEWFTIQPDPKVQIRDVPSHTERRFPSTDLFADLPVTLQPNQNLLSLLTIE